MNIADDKEIRAYYETIMARKQEVPLWEKHILTIEEASAYSGIGKNILRELCRTKGCLFVIWKAHKAHIVREKFEKEMETKTVMWKENRNGESKENR